MTSMKKISALVASLCIGFGGMTTLAQAQVQAIASGYPSAPIKIVVGYSAGGPTDLAARLIATKLQVALGQSVLVENRPGAGSNLASEIVARAAPDGLTLLMAAAPLAVNGHLYKNLKFDVLTSFAPITQVMAAPSILAVPPATPAKTMAELIVLARKEPGKLSYSSSGAGGTQHLAGELLQQKANLKLIHIPYKGASPALNDLLGGRVSMGFMTSLGSVPYFKDGRLLPLAVASATRLPQLPDVPTMAEVGLAGVEIDSWSGLLAPANTPLAIVERLQREVAKALASPDVNSQLVSQGAVVVGSTPAAFRAFLAKEHTNYGALIKSINLELN